MSTKNITRDELRMKQNNIAADCKENPKRFQNFVNSKMKCRERIDELITAKSRTKEVADIIIRAVERLIFLIALIARLIILIARQCVN